MARGKKYNRAKGGKVDSAAVMELHNKLKEIKPYTNIMNATKQLGINNLFNKQMEKSKAGRKIKDVGRKIGKFFRGVGYGDEEAVGYGKRRRGGNESVGYGKKGYGGAKAAKIFRALSRMASMKKPAFSPRIMY